MQRKKQKNKKSPNPKRSPMQFLLIGLGLLLVINLFMSPSRPDKIPYSEFKTKIKEGAFKRVYFSDPYVVGELKEGVEHESKFTAPSWMKIEPSLSAVKVAEDKSLIELLDQQQIPYEHKIQNRAFRDFLLTWILPLGLMFFLWTLFMKRMGGGPGSEIMRFGKSKNKMQAQDNIKTRFKDVAGQDEAKDELVEIVDFLKNPKQFTHLGGKLPKGVLLVGPPGTGKTLLAKAVAGEAKVPFFYASGSDFVEMFVGVGASRVRDLFEQAKKQAPCIIFIDELDAVGKSRSASNLGGHDEREQTLNQLLVEMDGFDSKAGVIVLAATNRAEILDKALLRAGRFDRQIGVGQPDVKERQAILELHAKNIKMDEAVDLEVVAKGTTGMVGADLANVINQAALLAARFKRKTVMPEDFEEAIERTYVGLEKKKMAIRPHEKKVIAHHEAGHAIVAAFNKNTDKVHKISIIPRGLSALGYTRYLPIEDQYLSSKSDLIGRVDSLLGGQAAEDIIFGEISTGASDDLKRASAIVRNMITKYGMGESLGSATLYEENNEYSDDTLKNVDQEVKGFLKQRMDAVKALLKKQIKLLEEVAQTLLEKEVIEAKEFEELVSKHTGGKMAF
ncbi:MAG TPA: ATP-dependent zinc metalloprotease FtsH [Oligoflexia bacterium]|nr:ATP-dependent zinc metalloprotease FtsH [Oligoflexia bacterium]HMR25094.1 ATP-dependent zinc metalloprotease FtsH [Oligoflexia bacterium]